MSDFLANLSSHDSSKRLEQISKLRSRGIGNHINLPQLVVCGDQSVGKSSVLEGITGLPFPRQEGLCTRFATEITLTHSDAPLAVHAAILPDQARPKAEKLTLLSYKRRLENFEVLTELIPEVGQLMGVRGFNKSSGPAFVQDVLQIRVTGRTGLHLTVVDLPGLISSANEEQSKDDVRTVHALVDRYVASSRTIALAVVQAGNDIANQGIIQKAKHFDAAGSRTIGVITKPDLINAGTEHLLAALARNEGSTKLTLGFFLVKNPSPTSRSSVKTLQQWEQYERNYFTKSPWQEQGLDMSRVGVSELRKYLQSLLDRHIRTELPAVQDAIAALIKKTSHQIDGIGEERPTPGDIRMYLSRVAMRFYNLTSAAVNGDYYNNDPQFFAVEDSAREHVRLRAFVHNQNMEFANDMRLYGKTTALKHVLNPFASGSSDAAWDAKFASEAGQRQVSEEQMNEMIMQMYRRTRGRELPGNHNYAFLAELFQHQSKRWKEIANRHMESVASALRRFVEEEIQYMNIEGRVQTEILKQARFKMDVSKNAAALELRRLCEDKDGPPITYNHYYTDNVQKIRNDAAHNGLEKALAAGTTAQPIQFGKSSISPPNIEASKVLEAHQKSFVQVDMDKQACEEAKVAHDAYYKVASKSFVDNVCIQVIERHLLRNLPNAFSPELVAGLSDAELHRTAGEEESAIRKRRELKALHQSLVEGLEDLQRI